MRVATRFGIVSLTLFGCVGCDQASKSVARIRELRQIVAMALIAGGGISNLLDRLMNEGRVTDFLNIGYGPLRTGIFNFADMAILAGALFFVLGYRTAAPDH